MPRSAGPFTLCDTISGVLAEICDGYGIDNHWLSWQFERAMWAGSASPLRLDTNSLVQKRPLKEGVSKVVFEIEFDCKDPNTIKWIRFHEVPSRKHYIVTQTSIDHVREDTQCALWIELSPAARKEDIQAVQALLKVGICCTEWKDSLPKEPYTALERAHLVLASGDELWLKKQIIHKDMATRTMSTALDDKIAETDALKKEVERLQRELELANQKNAAKVIQTPSPPRKKARKLVTPRTKSPKSSQTSIQQTPVQPTPNGQTSLARKALPSTAPPKVNNFETRHLVPVMTPTRYRSGTQGASGVGEGSAATAGAAAAGAAADDSDDDILY